MKTTQILAFATLSLGFLSTVQAAEVFNNTKVPVAIRATYRPGLIPRPPVVALLEPDEIVDIREGFQRIEIYPAGGDLGPNVLKGVKRAEHRSK